MYPLVPIYHEETRSAHQSKIHISKLDAPEEDASLASKAVKLMHRFSPEAIQSKMDEVEKRP